MSIDAPIADHPYRPGPITGSTAARGSEPLCLECRRFADQHRRIAPVPDYLPD